MLHTDGARDRRSWRVGARLLAAAVSVVSVAMAVDLVGRAYVPVEVVTPLTLALALGACTVALVGAATVMATRNGDVAVLSFGASILLPIVLGIVLLLARRAPGRRRVAIALLAGPVTAVGVVILLVIWVQPPVVECHEDAVETSSRPWWSSQSGSGSSGSGSSGASVSSGSIQTPSGAFEYRCEGATLAEFRRS